MSKRATIYLRVSTDGQTTENQRQELERVAKASDWEIIEVYEDAGISGAKGRDQRPAFNKLCQDATRRQFDVVMSWSVDRLGRSLQHLVGFLGELHAANVDLYLHKQGIDTTTPAGKAMFQMMGVFAEFERAMISQRVKAGLQRTKKKLGRPKVNGVVERKVLKMRQQGVGKRKISQELRIGVGTVLRIIKEAA